MRNSYLRIISLSLSLFFCSRIYSQYYEWAFTLTNNYGAALIRDIAYDGSGNVYIVGRFKGTLDLDPSGTTNNVSTPTTGTYDYDTFVAKYNSSGSYQFGFRVGGTANDEPSSIEIDSSGNIFISGVAGTTNADFDPSGNTANPSVTGNYIAKYNSSGAYQWVKIIGVKIIDMKVDNSSNIYITGDVSSNASGGTVDFDPSGNNSNHSVSNSNNATQDKAFIAKYNSSGAYQWAGIIGDSDGNGESQANGIDVDDSGNVYVTGYFSTGNSNSSDFDPSGSSANLTSNGVDDMFVAKYNSSGAYVWVRGFGDDNNDNSGYDHGFDIIVDGTGNVHVGGGKFVGTIDFDPSGSTANHTLSNDGIILKLNTSGEYLWSKDIKNENGIQVRRIDIDGSGNVYAFAEFQIDASFDSAGTTIKPVDYSSGNSGNDMALFAKWASDGTYKWAKWFNGSSSPSLEHEAIALNAGNIYLGGWFNNTIDFDPSNSTANISGGGGFLAKYNQAPQISSVTSTTSDGYYNQDDVIAIKINFTETVIVSGTPQLTLETGGTDAVVNYSSGTGSSALIFNYTVASGHTSSDLDYLSTTALALNSGTIKNSSNTAADLTLPSPGAGNSLGANKALVVDTTNPTVSSVSSTTSDGTYQVGQTIAITITFNETVVVTGTPQLTLETGSSDAVVDYSSGSNSTVLTFNYTVSNNQTSSDLDYGSTSSLALNSGTIKDLAGNNATLTLASPGASNSLGANKAIVIASSVTSVTSTATNGTFKISDVIPITINFSGNVTVSGTPQLTLETGSTDAVVNYSSGTGSSALIFNYTVASGHTTSDLDYKSTSALALNSGTIQDASNNAAIITLATPGATNSLGANKALVIDGIVPTVSSVSSSTNNGTYKIGNTIAINVTFSEVVNVVTTNGTPRIKLETGSTDQNAAYFSGSGSTILTFSYTVQSGDASSDLDYVSTTALELNSGTIKDGAGNSATLTLVNPGTSNSLGVNKSIVIDGVIPTVTFSPANNATGVQLNSNITITFSEAVQGGYSALSDTNVDALITLKNSNSSGSNIAFDATINSGKTIITINPSSDFSSEQVVYVAIGAMVEDGAGNAIAASNATFTGADINATTVTFSPANGASNVAVSSNVTITLNEAIRKIDDSEITNTNVDALITLKNSNSSGSDIAFDATINSGKTLITINPTNDFSSSQVVYSAIGATVEDDANNAITAISSIFTVTDIVSPTIASGSLSTDNSYIDITMNEGVYNTNGGSGALEKTDFIITFAQNSGNATAASISSIKNNSGNALSGGESVIRINLSITGTPSGVETVTIVPASSTSIYDASGNAMATSQTTGAKTLNDKLAPVFASEYPKVANESGTSFDILVKINEAGKGYYVILSNDATAPTAAEVKAGTGSSAATAIKSGNFALTKDTEKSEGITGLTSETAYDVYVVTEDGETTPNIQSSPTKIDVNTADITLPTVSSVSSTTNDGTYKIGDVIAITITFSEAVTVTGTPQLTLETGSTDAVVDYFSGSVGTLTFNYTIASDHVTGDLDYKSTSALALNSGTIKDGAGNDATLTLASPGATNSLGVNKALVVDGVVPTLSFSPVNNATGININNNITITFSEAVRKVDDSALSDTNVDALITLKNTDVNGTDIAFDSTIDTDKKVITIDPTADFASEQVVYVAIGATVEDGAGNAISAANATFTIADVIAPVFASEYPKVANESGTSFDILVKINEAGKGYYVILSNDATAPTAAEVKAGTGSSAATAIKSGNFALTKDTEKSEGITGLTSETAYDVYVVTEDGETTPNIQSSPTKIDVSTIDNIPPTVSKISSNSVNGTYITVGDIIPITIKFSEIVIVTGTPQLTMETGANDALANYDSGTGSDSLTFHYIIASGDTSNDLSYVSSSALILNSGTIKDKAGNEAILALPEPGATNSLSANKAIVIDALPAMVLSVSSTAIDSIYKLGSVIPVTVHFSEIVKVEGTPQIILSTGSPVDSANYISGSTTDTLTFSYNVSSGDNSIDLSYNDQNALILNNGTIKDLAGNDALLTLVSPGVESSLSANKQLIIDGVVPSISSINEGSLNTDLDYQNNQTDLTLSWAQAVDAFFDTMYYDYSLGITKGGKEIIEWTSSNGELKVQLSGLTLIENVTYYSSVKATDGAGNISPILQGDGITIDKTAPLTSDINDGIGEDVDISTSNKTISANWVQFNDATSYVVKYEYTVGTVASGNDVKDWTDIGVDTSFIDSSFTLNHAQIYFVSVKATDAAENVSKVSTSDGVTIDLYPGAPAVSSISLANGSYLPLIEDIAITIDFSEEISDYKINMSSKLNNTVNNNHSKDMNQITLNIKAPLTSLDTLSLLIKNVTDLVGNISDDIEYQFPTSLTADFTGDQIIDASDLTIFLNAWNDGDTKYELGPVEGTPPHFTITKDGKYDLRDLMSLTRIWDWSRTALSKLSARSFEQSGDSLKHYVLDNNISLFIPKDVGAVDLFINYPSLDVSVKSLETTATVEKILLSYADSKNGILKIVAGYLEPKVRIINLPYNIKGKENIPINIGFRMIGNNGVVIGQGEKTIQLVAVPKKFQLHQNYPNPFNPVTTINYDLPQQTHVNIMIYDILGREVVKLVSEEIPAGYQSVIWNTRNSLGTPVSAGIYFYQIQIKGFVKTRKMVLLK